MSAVMYLFEEPVTSQESGYRLFKQIHDRWHSWLGTGSSNKYMTADIPGWVQALIDDRWLSWLGTGSSNKYMTTDIPGWVQALQTNTWQLRACTQPGMSAVMYLFEEPVPSQECQWSCICLKSLNKYMTTDIPGWVQALIDDRWLSWLVTGSYWWPLTLLSTIFSLLLGKSFSMIT
jgi:hypothetical protein